MARKRGAAVGGGKTKPLVPPLKGAKGAKAIPPPAPTRGRVAIALPVLKVAPTPGRGGPPPLPVRPSTGRGVPPPLPVGRRVPVAPETPRAERLEAPPPRPSSASPLMRQRGARQTMAAMRRGSVPF